MSKRSKRYKIGNFFIRAYRAVGKLFVPRKYWHRLKTLPYLKLIPFGEGCWTIVWKGQKLANTAPWSFLQSIEDKARVFLIGSGPSVSRVELDNIGSSLCILLNGAVSLLKDDRIENCMAIVIEDARFVAERANLLEGLPVGTRLCVTVPVIHELCFRAGHLVDKFAISVIDNVITPYQKARRSPAEVSESLARFGKNGVGISLDISRGHIDCGTVMYTGIQIALSAGFKEINLLGFDMKNTQAPRFYENEQNKSWSGLDKALVDRVIPAMELTREIADERGVNIYNLSDDTAVPYEVIPYKAGI